MSAHIVSSYTRKSPDLQRGLVVIELAIVTPLVLLIMLATAEFGRAFYQYTTLSKAVEAGARYYASTVLDPAVTDAVAIPTVENIIVYASPQSGGTSVLPNFSTSDVTEISFGSVADHVRVSAQYNFVPIVGNMPIFGAMANFTMTATHTMRAL